MKEIWLAFAACICIGCTRSRTESRPALVGAAFASTPPAVEGGAGSRAPIETCPTGANDVRPDRCTLSDAERAGLRAQLHWATANVLDRYHRAVESFRKDVVDADTRSTLDQLLVAVTADLARINESAITLDDKGLFVAIAQMEGLSQEHFQEQIGEFLAAFDRQVAPLGHSVKRADAISQWAADGGTYAAVKILIGDRLRYAQVSAKPTGGHALAAMRRIVGAHDQGASYRFIRWIDDSLSPTVEDAPLVAPDRIVDVPLAILFSGATR